MSRTMADISEAMRDIDFCTLSTHAEDGAIAARPMSNNREVDYRGDTWFFAFEHSRMIADIGRSEQVGITYMGNPGLKGLLGAPGAFIHVQGNAKLVRDRSRFAAHWNKSLDRWFTDGPDTPGTVMIVVGARRIHYWDGEENGEVAVGS